MADDSDLNSKRRPARPQPLPVEFQLVGNDDRLPGWLSEMTLAGALLEPARSGPLQPGARLRVFVRVLGIDEELQLRAVVRWERRLAVGLQFFKLSGRDVMLIMETIAAAESSARAAGPTRRTT